MWRPTADGEGEGGGSVAVTDSKLCKGQPRCFVCPNRTWAAAVEVAGLMSVKLFGATGDGVTGVMLDVRDYGEVRAADVKKFRR